MYVEVDSEGKEVMLMDAGNIKNLKFIGSSLIRMTPQRVQNTNAVTESKSQVGERYEYLSYSCPGSETTFAEYVSRQKAFTATEKKKFKQNVQVDFFLDEKKIPEGQRVDGLHFFLMNQIERTLRQMADAQLLNSSVILTAPSQEKSAKRITLHIIVLDDGSPFRKSDLLGVAIILGLDPHRVLIKSGHSSVIPWFLGWCKEEWVEKLFDKMNSDMSKVTAAAFELADGSILQFLFSFLACDGKMMRLMLAKAAGKSDWRCAVCSLSTAEWETVAAVKALLQNPYYFFQQFFKSLMKCTKIFDKEGKAKAIEEFKLADNFRKHACTGFPFFTFKNKVAFKEMLTMVSQLQFGTKWEQLSTEQQGPVKGVLAHVLEVARQILGKPVPTLSAVDSGEGYSIQHFLYVLSIDHPIHNVGVSVIQDTLCRAFQTERLQLQFRSMLLRLVSENTAACGLFKNFHSYEVRKIFYKAFPFRCLYQDAGLPLAFSQFLALSHVVFIQVYSQDWGALNKALFSIACSIFRKMHVRLTEFRHESKIKTAKEQEGKKDITHKSSTWWHYITEWPKMQKHISGLLGVEMPLVHLCEGSIDHFLGMFKKMLDKVSGNRGAWDVQSAVHFFDQQIAAQREKLLRSKKGRLSKSKKSKFNTLLVSTLVFDPCLFDESSGLLDCVKAAQANLEAGALSCTRWYEMPPPKLPTSSTGTPTTGTGPATSPRSGMLIVGDSKELDGIHDEAEGPDKMQLDNLKQLLAKSTTVLFCKCVGTTHYYPCIGASDAESVIISEHSAVSST